MAQPPEGAEAIVPLESRRGVQTRREGVLTIYSRTPSTTGIVIEMNKEEAQSLSREARAQECASIDCVCPLLNCYMLRLNMIHRGERLLSVNVMSGHPPIEFSQPRRVPTPPLASHPPDEP